MYPISTAPRGSLILEDNTRFPGISFGAPTPLAGEVIFNTGMVGYPESLTDPSYLGQILVLTYPMVGNYGVPEKKLRDGLNTRFESSGIHISGLIVSQYSPVYSHWQATQSLSDWLKNHNIPALSGIDTRALTKHLRNNGTLLGKIVFDDNTSEPPFFDPSQVDLCQQVSIKTPMTYGKGKLRILLIDCGCKENIIHQLLQYDVEVKCVPYDYDIRTEPFDGLLISNGPGNPDNYPKTAQMIRYAIEQNIPTFGICLGHQLIAKAIGAQIVRLKYGHHSQNQPVKEVDGNRCYITSQNHNYVVDNKTLPAGWKPWFINLNDGSNEGLCHESGRFKSVQFHPEAAPGPVDAEILLSHFYQCIKETEALNP